MKKPYTFALKLFSISLCFFCMTCIYVPLKANNYKPKNNESHLLSSPNDILLSIPIINIISSSNPNCFGNNDGSASVNASGGTPPYTFLWSNGATTSTVTELLAGNYQVTVTDALSATASTSITLTDPGEISTLTSVYSNYNGADISCAGQSDGQARVLASGGLSPYIYTWNDLNNQTTSIASGLLAGSYTVTVTDAVGCMVTNSVNLSDPLELNATEIHTDVFCYGDSTAQINVSAINGTLGGNNYEYAISGPGSVEPFSNNNLFSNLIAGTYTVTVRDGNDCEMALSIEINQTDTLTGTITSNPTSCNGGTDGSLNTTITGGSLPYSFLWNDNSTSSNLDNVAASGYNVTITDANSCIAVLTGTVNQPDSLYPIITSNSPSCDGGSNGQATVSVTGGSGNYGYLWSNGSTLNTISNLSAGNYTLTVMDDQSCSTTQSFVLTSPDSLSAILSINNVSCGSAANGSASISPSGGTSPYTYLWSNGQTDSVAQNLSANSYSVVVTDSEGCLFQESISLTEPNDLSLSLLSISSASCNGLSDGGASIQASGGVGSFTYLWSNGQTTETVSNLDAASTHHVTVTDANNCTTSIDVNITEPSSLSINSINTTEVSCKFGTDGTASASASGGTSLYTYAWSDGQTGQAASNLSAGSYTITVTDFNNCQTTSTLNIIEPNQQLTASSNSSSTLCSGASTGEVSVFAGGGTTPYTYTWSTGANTQILDSIPAGSYTVTVSDANACLIDLDITVSDGTNMQLSILSQNNVSCYDGTDGSIIATVSGGNLPLTYLWSDPSGQDSLTCSNLSVGTYYITATDANACISVDSATITEPDKLSIDANTTDVSCYGGNDGYVEVFASNSTITLYEWSTGLQNNTGQLTNLQLGTYYLTATDNNGCQAEFNYKINQPDSLISSLIESQSIQCYGDDNGEITALVTGGTENYSYIWSNGGDTSSSPIREYLVMGDYSVEILDSNGCTAQAEISLEEPTEVQVQTTTINETCPDESDGRIIISGSGGTIEDGNYAFSKDSLNWQTGNIFSATSSGIYTLYAMDDRACLGDTTITIDAADPFFIASFSQDTTLEFGDTLSIFAELNDTTGVNYSWTRIQGNGQSGPEVSDSLSFLSTPVIQTSYLFEAKNTAGCSIDSTLTILVERPMRVGLAGAFSPNGDGINDYFFVQTDEKVSEVIHFRVYARWGELVYEVKNINPNSEILGWDGTFKEKNMNPDVFAWYAEIEFIDGTTEIFRGNTTLFR